jgi:hypothetical protein
MAARIMSVEEAGRLREDLIQAFNATDFQLRLLTMRQSQYVDESSFLDAKRDAVKTAQNSVLHKYGLKQDSNGVAEMVKALAFHIIKTEKMKPSKAHRKAQALCVGMAVGQQQGWFWPRFVPPSDDTASTATPASEDNLESLHLDEDVDSAEGHAAET